MHRSIGMAGMAAWTLFVSVFLLACPARVFAGEPPSTSIFFLGSGSADTPWTRAVIQGLKNELEQSELPYVFSVDHLEAARFDETTQSDLMFRYLREKFSGREPDIFIAAGPAASRFAARHPDFLSGAKRMLIHPGPTHIDGVLEIEAKIDYSELIREMLRLADPETIYVIGDSVKPSDKHRLGGLLSVLKKEKAAFRSLENMPLDDLLSAVSDLPEKSAVYFTPIYREYEGKGLAPVYVLEKIHEVADAPIFSESDSTLGYGIVGGYLHSPKMLGMMAGEAVCAWVRGEPVEFTHNGFGFSYDWNELVRWGYLDNVHEDAEILFRKPTMWEQYRTEVIVLFIVFFLLLFLSAALIVINKQLKKAKNSLAEERMLLEERVEERTSELAYLHKKAEETARIDVLTQLDNRRSFFEKGEIVHSHARRYGHSYSVMMLDIDHFKEVNDTYGHAAGDAVIQQVAKIISSSVRQSDVAARIGGEEFAVILIESGAEQLRATAERIRSAVCESPVPIEGKTVVTSVSIGLADLNSEDAGIDSILARADKALYEAKAAGRNRVVSFPEF